MATITTIVHFSLPKEKMDELLAIQALGRLGARVSQNNYVQEVKY